MLETTTQSTQNSTIAYHCLGCQQTAPTDAWLWRCPACGGPLELTGLPAFAPTEIDKSMQSLWRYRAMLPPTAGAAVSLGEGWTPLIEVPLFGRSVHCKLEYFSPTGSYKDRGVAVMVAALKRLGLTDVVDDSSGNAGASLAAYAAHAGLKARIFVPAHASPAKQQQIAIYGAHREIVDGPRSAANQAAQEAAAKTTYASHTHSPYNLAGLETIAWELWEQLGGRAPTAVVLPVGQGTLLLGAYYGFRRLADSGWIDHLPQLIGVQAEACAPVYSAWKANLNDVPPVAEGKTAAEGIRISAPVRGRALLEALRETHGVVVAVSETEIAGAQKLLAERGLYVEPTSAAAVAGLGRIVHDLPEKDVVLVLTGSGLKTHWDETQPSAAADAGR